MTVLLKWTYLSWLLALHGLQLAGGSGGDGAVEIFSAASFADLSLFRLQKMNSSDSSSWAPSLTAYGAVWLTPDPRNTLADVQLYNVGRLMYSQPIRFRHLESGQVLSFSTAFTFQIISTGAVSGDGIAFSVTADPAVPDNSTGRFLGLKSQLSRYPAYDFVAVEFDTFQNLEPDIADPSPSHVGIDVNALKSVATLDTSNNNSQLFLHENSTFAAWIAYNASSAVIHVWATNITIADSAAVGLQPPADLRPCLSTRYNLSDADIHDTMYVAISAAAGNKSQGTVVYSWYFSVEDSGSQSRHARLLSSSTIAVIAAMASLVGLAAAALLAFRQWRSYAASQRRTDQLRQTMGHGCDTVPRLSYRQITRASQSFHEKAKVGEGAYSRVYKGVMSDGTVVAVKRLKEGIRMEEEFTKEVQIISQIRHRNLLQLLGWCYERGEALLVYQYMANGSLDEHLFGRRKEKAMLRDEALRYRVLEGVASAMEYLHTGLQGGCVLHRDVKAANVLLTDKMEAVVGDFGLAKLIGNSDQDQVQLMTMTAAGTPGYVAPELVYQGKATDKADVYSFGVLAMEVACGRRALDPSFYAVEPGRYRLLDWVWGLYQAGNIMDALDRDLSEQLCGDNSVDNSVSTSVHYSVKSYDVFSDSGSKDRNSDRDQTKNMVHFMTPLSPNINELDHELQQVQEKKVNILQRPDGELRWRCVLHLGIACCHPCPDERPTMRQVRSALQEARVLPLPECRPVFPNPGYGDAYASVLLDQQEASTTANNTAPASAVSAATTNITDGATTTTSTIATTCSTNSCSKLLPASP